MSLGTGTIPVRGAAALALLALGLAGVRAPVLGAQAGANGTSNGGAPAYPVDPETLARPSLRAMRIAEPIRIDGRLDHFSEFAARYESSGARHLAGSLAFTHGDFYDGRRTSLSARATLRPSPHLSLETFVEHNDVRLAGHDFTADIGGGRVKYAASTRLFASAFVQYLDASNELVSNVRLNYLHAPLSDLFLVLTERRDLDSSTAAERLLTLKVTRLFAF